MISTAIAFAADTAKEQQAQQRAEAPVLGYRWAAEARELRAILGVPGAARWSDSIPLPQGVTALRLAPGHRWALASLEDGTVATLTLDSLVLSKLETGGVVFDSVEFSPSGTSIALRNSETGEVVAFTGGPDRLVKAAAYTAHGAIALSDSGGVAYIVEDRLMNAANGAARFVMACSNCRFGFFPGSESLAVLESNGHLSEVTLDGPSRLIAEGVEGASLLASSANSITLAEGAVLRILDRQTGVLLAREDSGSQVTALDRMRHTDAWLLSGSEADVLWMHSREGIRFVPARSVATSAGEVQE
jgi:hypothetical protein